MASSDDRSSEWKSPEDQRERACALGYCVGARLLCRHMVIVWALGYCVTGYKTEPILSCLLEAEAGSSDKQ